MHVAQKWQRFWDNHMHQQNPEARRTATHFEI